MLKVLAGILIVSNIGLENIFGYIIYEQNQNQLLDSEELKDNHFSNYYKNIPEQEDKHRRNERTQENAVRLEDQNTSDRKRSISIADLNNVTLPLESNKSPLITFFIQISSLKADYDRLPNITLSISSDSSVGQGEGTPPLPSSRSARTKRENRVVSGPMDVRERRYLREEVQKVLNQVTFLRGSNKMPASSQQPLDNLKVKLEKLLVEVDGRPTA